MGHCGSPDKGRAEVMDVTLSSVDLDALPLLWVKLRLLRIISGSLHSCETVRICWMGKISKYFRFIQPTTEKQAEHIQIFR